MIPIPSKQLKKAIDVLQSGGVVVFPTETSYGLAADATNPRAVERVFAIKGRPQTKTMPIIVSGMAMATDLIDFPKKLKALARQAWPGPLTVVAPVQEGNDLATGIIHTDGTIALRISSHPVAQYLTKKLKRPIVSTSANLATDPPAFSIPDLQKQFSKSQLQPDFILDMGPLTPADPSTIVKEVDGKLVVVREGSFIVPGSKHRAKKSFGQHFLKDKTVIEKIIAAAEIKTGETVVEVGPGQGVLTQALVEAGAKVVAVEADQDLVPVLKDKFGEKIELIEGDIQKIDLAKVLDQKKNFKIVANLPYNISSSFLESSLKNKTRPVRMVLMLQKEVVDRIVAKPPKMSLLSVVCQIYADCRKVTKVPRGAFQPMPKVESAVIQMDLREPDSLKGAGLSPEKVISLAKAGFSSKRKQLRSNLAAAKFGSREDISTALEQVGQNPQARAEVLTVEDWINLAQELDI